VIQNIIDYATALSKNKVVSVCNYAFIKK